MTTWSQFEHQAPRIATILRRRHAATGNLCFLGTLRADGYPRISPLEPQFVGDQLALVGMPGTRKFRDLERDPRFTLHTATVDTQVGDGDAKIWGTVQVAQDEALRERLLEIYAAVGHDRSEQDTFPMYVVGLVGASSMEVVGDRLRITVWKEGQGQREMYKQ